MVPSWQGVGLGARLVFVGLRNGQVAALRQETGELVWVQSVGSAPQEAGEAVTTAPMYARGRVFVGLANGDTGGQGRIIALDAETGEPQWTFFIVPRPGEFGHDTWPQDSNTWEQGGGGVWLVGTVDPDLGLVYFATGNPVPMFGGEIRAGDNLFTASVLALDIETGERRWHYQVVRHDVWDADIATPLMLYDHDTGAGTSRKALAAMRADGILFLFDRETGEPLTPIEDREVPQDAHQRTAATQPYPVGAESILPDCSFWRDRVPPPFELSCSGFTPPMVNEHTIVAPGVPIPRVRVTPDVLQPADRLHLRAGPGDGRSGAALRGSLALAARRQRADAAGPGRHPRRRRYAEQSRGLEARGPGVAARHQRSANHRGRSDVPRLGRRPGRGLRRSDGRAGVDVPHQSRRSATAAGAREHL